MIIGMGKGSTSDEIMDYLSNIWLNGIVISCLLCRTILKTKKQRGLSSGTLLSRAELLCFGFINPNIGISFL